MDCLMQSAYDDDQFEGIYSKVARFSILSKPELKSVYDRLHECMGVDGDVIEFGTCNGGVSLLVGLVLEHNGCDKKIHMLDSFAGLPSSEDPLDGDFRNRKGSYAANVDRVRRAIRAFGLDDIAVVYPGWFHQSIPTLPADLTIALAHLDADLHDSTKIALEYLLPRVSSGGAIVMDDFYSSRAIGVATAFKECIGDNAVVHLGPDSQAYVFPNGRRHRAERAAVWVEEGGVKYDVSTLIQDSVYMQHVAAKLQTYGFNDVIHRVLGQCLEIHQRQVRQSGYLQLAARPAADA
jgi:hypothetical protein